MIIPGQEPVYLKATIITFSTGVRREPYYEIYLNYNEPPVTVELSSNR